MTDPTPPPRPPDHCSKCHKPIAKYIPEGMSWYPCRTCNGQKCEACCEDPK